MQRRRYRSACGSACAIACAVLAVLSGLVRCAVAAESDLDAPVRVHALVGARLVVAPGSIVPVGTVVLRDGVIVAAGAQVAVPPDARVWKVDGLTIYPGLIEAYAVRSVAEAKDSEKPGAGQPGAGQSSNLVRPERDITTYPLDASATKSLRGAGFTTAVVAPKEGLFRGRSALVALADGGYERNLLRRGLAQNVTVRPETGDDAPYPESLMGAVALFRQTLHDAAWQSQALAAYARNPAQARPVWSAGLEALAAVAAGKETVVFETDDVLDTLRDAALAREFKLQAWIVGNGEEYQRLAQVQATGLPQIVPLRFPKPPVIAESTGIAGDVNVELDALRHWDLAPENPQRILGAGIAAAWTTFGLEDPNQVHESLSRCIARGLTPAQALAGFTTVPAKLLGIADRAGTIEAGKMANLVLVDGDLFVEKPKIREVWVDGDRFEIKESKPPTIEPAGTWELTARTEDGQDIPVTLILTGKAGSLTGTIATMGQTIALSSADVSGAKLDVAFPGDAIGMAGPISFTLEVSGETATGGGTGPQGSFSLSGKRTSKPETSR